MQYPRFLLAVTLLGAPALALHAQSSSSGGDARAEWRERSAQIEAKMERLRREIVLLERRRHDAAQRSEAAGDSAERELEPRIERAARALAQLQTALVQQSVEQRLRQATVSTEWRVRSDAAKSTGQGYGYGFTQQWPTPAAAPVAGQKKQPPGWVGVTFSGPLRMWQGKEGLAIYYYDFPVIESVEPGSPAERAGLQAGDTVLAYDGRDVRKREISLARQLRPGARLLVRVRRDGTTRDVPVTIERRPATYGPSYAVTAPPAPPAGPVDLPDPLPPKMKAPKAPRAPQSTPDPVVIVTPVAPSATVTIFGSRPAVAGAELARMVPDLREVFGVDGGVLVLNVASGSPAAGAGLRAGDVILRVNDKAVATPQALQRAVQECQTRSARLDVVRKKKHERLTLRW